jgi:hypothetical protein
MEGPPEQVERIRKTEIRCTKAVLTFKFLFFYCKYEKYAMIQ